MTQKPTFGATHDVPGNFPFHHLQGTGNGRLLLAFLLAVLLAVSGQLKSASAQVLYGSLTGTVADPSGAVIQGAEVTALEVQTGVTHTQATDSTGNYRFNNLFPGTYKVTIASKGFSTQETSGVLVQANEIARVNAQLKAESSTQNVTVTTEAPLLQTDKADVHTDISAQQIEDLPTMGTQGRNFQNLLRVIPGAGLTAETNSLAGNPQRAINANVNGQSQQGNNTRIDGAQDAYPYLPSNVAYVPPADAIETVNVATNSFDAEQGMAGGAAMNVQIKSGTNKFHGSAHEFHTDQNFAARNYFNTDITRFPKLNRNNQNQFGGTFGGPILHDRLFFFGDYERTTQRQLAGPGTRTLPTAAMITGDFRGLPGNPIIYDPATGDAHGAGKQQVSCNGVLNVICPSRIDPAAAAMAKLLQPLVAQEIQTGGDGHNNWVGSGTALFNRDNADFKINYVPTANSTVFGRYSFSKTLAFDPPLLGAAIGDATNGGQLGNAPGLIQSIGLGATRAFTPRLLLDWNFGFTRQRIGSTFDLTSARGLTDLGIPGTNNAGATGDPSLYYGYPGFTFTTPNVGVAALGNAQPANPFLFRDQQFVTGVNLSWSKGKHALRGGLEWNHAQINHFQPQGGTFQEARGAFQFNGNVTSLQGGSPTWQNGWADFLLGLPAVTGKARQVSNPTALRWSQWAWYAQDHFQVLPNLMLTLGVRWELYPFGYSDNGKGFRLLDLNTGLVRLGGYGGTPRDDGMDVGHGQFLARLGVAYQITSSTVIRAGYGQSADPSNWHVIRNAYPAVILDTNQPQSTADYIPAASLTGTNASGLGSGNIPTLPKGIVLQPIPDQSSGSITLPQSVGTTTYANPFRRGYINSFNLTLEQNWKGFVTDIGYVGTEAVRPLTNMNANPSLPGTGSAGGVLSQRYTQLGLCGSKACNYTGGINVLMPFKNNYYSSLQTKVTRRFAQGSSMGFSWTWSKAIDYAENEDLGFVPYPHPAFFNKDRAVASFDRTHNVEIYGVFALPFGQGQHWMADGVAGQILGGWLLDPIVTWMTGAPFTVAGNGSALNANGSSQTADLVGKFKRLHGKPPRNGVNCSAGDPKCSYFDPSVFAQPLICTSTATNQAACPATSAPHYGNTNRNEFRGPGFFNTNLSVLRDFNIKEKATLEVRADAFSLTNTPHFANPGTSCPAGAGDIRALSCAAGTSFGVITGTAQPGGFFGPDDGHRQLWLGATVRF